jgi:alanyl-tRNA synthetase
LGKAQTDKGFSIKINNTKSVEGVYLHDAELIKGTIQLNDEVLLVVDQEHRLGVKRHHSATHLLHYALGHVLGQRALQKGSLVKANYLRFDFTSAVELKSEDHETIERIVFETIIANHPIITDIKPYEEAKAMGAIGMFGEKYEAMVRVVKMGPSLELCGGTHAKMTGDLGLLLIESEKSIARGIRRIVAYTGKEALSKVQARSQARSKRLLEMGPTPKAAKASEPFTHKTLKEISLEDSSKVLIQEISRKLELGEAESLSQKVFAEHPASLALLIVFSTKNGRTVMAFSRKTDLIKADKLISHINSEFKGRGGGSESLAQSYFESDKDLLSFVDLKLIKNCK